MSISRSLAAGGLAVTAMAAIACSVDIGRDGVTEREQRRFAVDAAADLRLYTFDGAIEVRAWDRPEIVIDIEKRGRDREAVANIQVLAEQNGTRIQIEARQPGASGGLIFLQGSPHATVRLIANVPRNTNLVARTGDGPLVVERVTGRLELRTTDGSIRTIGTSGELIAETGDGSIHIEEVQGSVDVHTSDGSIRVTGVPGSLRARSGDGAIVLRVRTGAVMTSDWSVATDVGSISAELPPDFQASIEADPGGDGRARSEIGLDQASGGTREDRVLKGRIGHGGHTLVLRTGDGGIRLTTY